MTGAVQDMRKATTSKMPPVWALLGLVVLGWNEFTSLLYNPLLLMVLVIAGLFIWTVYRYSLLTMVCHIPSAPHGA